MRSRARASSDFGPKGQPHASPGQLPVYYPQPCNLVPTLLRGNAVFDALRRTHWMDYYQEVATSTNDSILRVIPALEYLQWVGSLT